MLSLMRSLRLILLALMALGLAGLATAQGEPTIQQIYATAQSGQVDKARQMTQEVLRTHPKSAKAHFVMAEIEASQGRSAQARDALATADALAPGLPFAKPEAVQALRSRLSAAAPVREARDDRAPAAQVARDPPPSPSFPWGMVLLAGAIVAFVVWRVRSRSSPLPAAAPAAQAAQAPAGYGPAVPDAAWGAQPTGSGPQAGYAPQAGYGPQAAQPGMGGRIMGGLATGLALGAGAVAAQEIGRRMLGDHQQQGLGSTGDPRPGNTAGSSQLANDAGLGSIGGAGDRSALPENFGINDGTSWDDGGSSDVGGGDDGGSWDN